MRRRRREPPPRHSRGQAAWERIQAFPLWAQPPLLGDTARWVHRQATAYDTHVPQHRRSEASR